MDEKYTVQTAMKWIVEKKGRSVFQNEQLINNILSDLARDEENDRKKVRLALSSGAGNLFYKMLQRNQNQIQISDIRLFQSSMESYGFTPDFSDFVLNTFLYAVSMPAAPVSRKTTADEKQDAVNKNNIDSTPKKENTSSVVSNVVKQPIPVWNTGDVIKFGRYQQDAGNNCTAREIEWIVLDVQKDKALLLSRFGLIAKPFDTSGNKDVSWKTCTLRAWMNNEFFKTAFNAEEQESILETMIECVRNYSQDNQYKKDVQIVQDHIFLLSGEEAWSYFGATDWHYSQLRTSPTDYAVSCGAAKAVFKRTKDGRATTHWWTRNCWYKGYSSAEAYTINKIGVSSKLPVWYSTEACVRPAVWVDLKSNIFK